MKFSWPSFFVNEFDPHSSFTNLSQVRTASKIIFWMALVPVISIFSSFVYHNKCFLNFLAFFTCFDLSSGGWNNLLSMYKLPIGILATLIPIFGLFAANHRSCQTKRQMELTEEQNNFANYYKHFEEFERYVDSLLPGDGARNGISIKNIRKTHLILFPLSKEGKYHSELSVKELIYTTSWKLHSAWEKDEGKLNKEFLLSLLVPVEKLEEHLGLHWFDFDSTKVVVDGKEFSVPDEYIQSLIRALFQRVTFVDRMLSFDNEYQRHPITEELDSLSKTLFDRYAGVKISEGVLKKIESLEQFSQPEVHKDERIPVGSQQYCVNKNAQANGVHEVHRGDCMQMPTPANRISLGLFMGGKAAINKARETYVKVDGCYYCMRSNHTG